MKRVSEVLQFTVIVQGCRPSSPQSQVELLLSGGQHDFPVLDGSAIVGILTRGNLLTALARREQRSAVADVMRRDFLVADASDMIDIAFQRLQAHECHTAPVVRRGILVGLLTMDNVGEFLGVQAAVGTQARLGQLTAPVPLEAARAQGD